MAALPGTYNAIIAKLLSGSADVPKEEEKK